MAEPVDPPVDPSAPFALAPDSAAVAVLVTRDPGPAFDDALASLAAQDHPAFSILVIDDGSVEPVTARVARIVPSAFVRRQEEPLGYGAAANLVRSMVSGAGFFLFCHDDVALAPDAVRLLSLEAVRSGAAIVGPKLVAWTDHDRLLAVGMSLDRAGNVVSLVERDERDQGQHDVAREVVAVSGAAMLVRADVFDALDGFDRAATSPVRRSGAAHDVDALSLGPDLGEDIDLCWRARISGYSIAIEPSARVAHVGLLHGTATALAAPADTADRLAEADRAADVAEAAVADAATGTPGGDGGPTGSGEGQDVRPGTASAPADGAAPVIADSTPATPRPAETDRRASRRSVLYRERNRIRSMLVTASGVRLPFIVPVLVVQTLWRMASPRHRETGASQGFAAWRGALSDVGGLRARRQSVQALRKVSDRDDLRRLMPIGARARAAFRADVSADSARLWNLAEAATTSSYRARRLRLLALGVAAVVWLLGSRGLIASGVTAVQQFAPLAASKELLRATFHTGVAGGSSAAAPALAFLGALTMLLLGAHGTASVVLSAGMLVVGAFTMWRLAGYLLVERSDALRRDRRDRSARRTPQGLGAIAYVSSGVGIQAIAAGRLDACVAHGLFPLALLRLLRAIEQRREQRAAPLVGASTLRRGAHAVGPVVPLAGVLAVLFAFAPGAIVPFGLSVVVFAVVAILSTATREPDAGRARDFLTTACIGIVGAAVLLLPFSVDLLGRGTSWARFTGGDVARTVSLRLPELLRLSGGLDHPSRLTWGLLGAAMVSLLIGSGSHLRIVVRGWSLLLASVAVLWLAGRGWLGAAVPHPLVMLAPATVGLALAAGLGAAVFADDVRSQRFGWRQVVSIVGFVVFCAALIPPIGASGNGRWGLPERSARATLSWLDTVGDRGPFRTVWIGSPRTLPIAGWPVDHDLALGVSTNGLPSIGDQWLGRRTPPVDAVIASMQAVRHGETSRVGARLAADGVRYVVVVERNGPTSPTIGQTSDLTAAFVRQFDLRPVESEPGVAVFENAAWHTTALRAGASPTGTSLLRGVQLAAWVVFAFVLVGRRRRRRSREALLLEQERTIEEPDDRIGDLFSTSFGPEGDDDAAFADFVSRTAEAPRRRAVLVGVGSGAGASGPASGGSRAAAVADAEGSLSPSAPASELGSGVASGVASAGSTSAGSTSDLPEDGSLADALWQQWSERQAQRAGATEQREAPRGPQRGPQRGAQRRPQRGPQRGAQRGDGGRPGERPDDAHGDDEGRRR